MPVKIGDRNHPQLVTEKGHDLCRYVRRVSQEHAEIPQCCQL